MRAIHEACADGRIAGDLVGIISNIADAPALRYAQAAGLPCRTLPHVDYAQRADFDAALLEATDSLQPDVVALAGFMRILDVRFVTRFAGRLLNIHPSLLPRHPGLHTHRRALAVGDVEHGATVHFVTAELDGGPAIIQGSVIVRADDDENTLGNRVMKDIELKIYPQTLAWFCRGELNWQTGRPWFRGQALSSPLTLDHLEEAFR